MTNNDKNLVTIGAKVTKERKALLLKVAMSQNTTISDLIRDYLPDETGERIYRIISMEEPCSCDQINPDGKTASTVSNGHPTQMNEPVLDNYNLDLLKKIKETDMKSFGGLGAIVFLSLIFFSKKQVA